MSSELSLILLATALISSGSIIGIVTISMNRRILGKILLSLVSLSAGTMLGAAFLHLLPESVSHLGNILPFELTLVSFIAFFLLERFLHWRHCHDQEHLESHTLGTLNLVGDAVHNFLDGLLIAASFAASPALGFASTLAIALHEIPQEVGDFGVLLHSGYSRRKALIANIGVSLTAVLGGVLGYYGSHISEPLSNYLVPIAAGGFIYIAAADLIPELKVSKSATKTLVTTATFLLGILLMVVVGD